MMCYLDPDFQRQLDEYNDAKGGPSRIAICWDSKKDRWRVWAVPVQDSHHPLARNELTAKMLRPLPDHSGCWGVPLNLWQGERGEYIPMDGRLFAALDLADSFGDREHFEKTVERPEFKLEAARNVRVLDAARGARQYWQKLDNLTISMNPSVRVGGDWRATKNWR